MKVVPGVSGKYGFVPLPVNFVGSIAAAAVVSVFGKELPLEAHPARTSANASAQGTKSLFMRTSVRMSQERTMSVYGAIVIRTAPVAQWIEQRFPKPRAHVRFMPGALASRGKLDDRARVLPHPELVDQHPRAGGAVLVVPDTLRKNVY